MRPIPFIRVSGSHTEVGRQIGAACRSQIRRALDKAATWLPGGVSWEDMRQAAAPYLGATSAALPWIVAELEGAAAGAGVELIDLVVLGAEEIWRHPPGGRCSDFAAGPPATFDGGIWLAHNNDLSPAAAEQLVAVEWQVEDQPRLFTLGLSGIYISVGFNSAGLSLTGNEVSPNDDRVGVPRLLVVRDILAQRTAAAAIGAATNPARASSYNNLIAHVDGTIVNVEGSATDYALLGAEDGWTVHTNHYVAPTMLRYEQDPSDIGGSVARYERARELMAGRAGPVTPALLRSFLADRANAPSALCRCEGATQTVFWCVIDLCHGAIDYGRDPREVEAQQFMFQ